MYIMYRFQKVFADDSIVDSTLRNQILPILDLSLHAPPLASLATDSSLVAVRMGPWLDALPQSPGDRTVSKPVH